MLITQGSLVRVQLDPPRSVATVLHGGLAQLGEHLLCKQGVNSSILLTSTNHLGGNVKSSKNPYSSPVASILAFADKRFFKNLEEVK